MASYEFKDDKEYIDFLNWKIEKDKFNLEARITVIESRLDVLLKSIPSGTLADKQKIDVLEEKLSNALSYIDVVNTRLGELESLDFMLMGDTPNSE